MSKRIGSDLETYRQYELKSFEIQDYSIAEKLIKELEMEEFLELPDYFKIMKQCSKEKIIEIVNDFGKQNLSEETNIFMRILISQKGLKIF